MIANDRREALAKIAAARVKSDLLKMQEAARKILQLDVPPTSAPDPPVEPPPGLVEFEAVVETSVAKSVIVIDRPFVLHLLRYVRWLERTETRNP